MADITLTVTEEDPIQLSYVEAKIKPEQAKSIVPTYEQQTVLPDPGMTLGSVTVEPIPEPTDTLEIGENGEYNVARIGTVDVDVPVPPGYMEEPNPGAWYSDYDEDGLPHTFTVRGYTTIQDFRNCFRNNAYPSLNRYVENLKVYSNLDTQPYCSGNNAIKRLYLHSDNQHYNIGNNQFSFCSSLESVVLDCDISSIQADGFGSCNNVMLYDFTKNTSVPNVPFWMGGRTLSHASGCVIRVPQRLLEEWQTAWSGNVTDVVWEGV